MPPTSDITADTAATRLLRQAERDAFGMSGETGCTLLARALGIALVDGRPLASDQIGATVAAAANFVLAAAQREAFSAFVQEHGTQH